MRTMRWSVSVLAVVVLCNTALAQKRPGDAPGELFFTIKGTQPFAMEKVYPGITAALQLSDDQKVALEEAMAGTIHSEKVRAAGAAVKTNPDATAEQRDAARKAQEDARKQLADSVAQVLTAEQKALVSKIQQAFEESQKAAMQALEGEFGAAKGNDAKAAELRQKLQGELKAELAQRLDKILTADQKSAVETAAMRQAEREAAAKDFKK